MNWRDFAEYWLGFYCFEGIGGISSCILPVGNKVKQTVSDNTGCF